MKKELFVKTFALGVVLFILVSFTNVVGYNSVKSTSSNDYPLFSTRIQKAINKDDSNSLTFEYLGKSSKNTIPVIESTSKKNDSEISLITLNVVGVNGGDNWYGNDNSFTFTYESNEIAEIYYGIDGNWSLYTGTFNVAQGGNHTLEWYAVDYDGNQSEIDGPFYFKVDKTKPELSLAYEVVGGNQWSGWDVMFYATACDSMIGMHHVEFYLNNVLQETVYGSGPVYTWILPGFNPDLQIVIYAIAFDKAGNSAKEDIQSPSYNVVKPKSFLNLENNYKKNSFQNFFNNILSSENIEIKNNKIFDKPSSSNTISEDFEPGYVIVVFNREFGLNNWINNKACISIFYEPNSINEVFYQFNNGSWLFYENPIVISEDGTYVFSWYAVDSEEYNSTIESFSFKVDLTSPQINLIKSKLTVNIVKFIAEVNDSTSGIDRVKFHSHNLVFYDSDYPYEWIWTGFLNDKVTATVYDKAGNINSQSMKTWNSHSNNHPRNQQFLDSLFIQNLKRLLNIK